MEEGRMRFDPSMYEDLEIVQERSIGSEMTYKNSLVDTETAKSTAKNGNTPNQDDIHMTRKHHFLKTANFGSEKSLLHQSIGINEERTYRETISRLEDRISSKNNLISQLKTYQIQLTDAFEKVKNENIELRSKIKALSSKSPPSRSIPTSNEKMPNFSKMRQKNDFEAMSAEIEALVSMCDQLKATNGKISSEKDFLKAKLKEAKDEILYLSDQLISKTPQSTHIPNNQKHSGTLRPHNQSSFDFSKEVSSLKDKISSLEKENSKLKKFQTIRPPSSEFSSNRVSHGPDEFSNTKSFRTKIDGGQKYKKFSDACCNLMIGCFPNDFDHERPSLKQVWRWIKGVLEDFVTLNKVFGELQDMLGANTVADVMFSVEKLTE